VKQLKTKPPQIALPEPLQIEPALLTIPQVCLYLNIKRATFYKINATGAFGLLPIKLGTCRKVLYSRIELEAFIKADCPHRKQWQTMKKDY
jgi:predicted DNA-binding transcriptional regulator AlpA